MSVATLKEQQLQRSSKTPVDREGHGDTHKDQSAQRPKNPSVEEGYE